MSEGQHIIDSLIREKHVLLKEIDRLTTLRRLDQMYIAELRRRCGLAPHDGEPARPGVEGIE